MPKNNVACERKPAWLRLPPERGGQFSATDKILADCHARTVCSDAKCPNRAECWARRTATIMILGQTCTRACRFCAIAKTPPPSAPETDEPSRVALAIKRMGLKYAVITSVTRDDLSDGGAQHWADTITTVRAQNPQIKIEALTPDFCGDENALATVFKSQPDVFAHNIETVRRLQKIIRGKADYDTSLSVLKAAADFGLIAKSSIIAGLGETDEEIEECLCDLYNAGVRAVTIGQYLSPSPKHWQVVRWVEPDEFKNWQTTALKMGFTFAKCDPLVRSSYRADDICR